MATTSRTQLLVNSSVALVLAGMTTVTLHELAHFVTSSALGHSTTLFATSVDSAATDVPTNIATAAAGPLFSLVFGLAIVFGGRLWGAGFGRLFWMWLGFTSAQTGFGYLMIAIIAPVGDTGKVLELLGAPAILFWVSLAVGIAGTLWLSRLFATRVVAYSDGTEPSMRAFGIFSWLIGTGALVLIYAVTVMTLPADAIFVSMMGIVALAIFAPMFSFFYKGVSVPHEHLALRTPIIWIVVTVVAALVVILVLNRGVTLG
ncbi:hypothetical protein [Microbacterium sp. Leaf320]|uniref:hypothetical protein n=1 Tax=Microbacterium sp. Leaf320 TaxID=1736334 RepID=UPI0006F3733A|nr:hypothetical protein [Microbacterium sp. Leaf320]KQQ67247.1 hypothetical protein ASF63_08580 [Microbacterium sp. Leaf320]